jgi:hypothetical protein
VEIIEDLSVFLMSGFVTYTQIINNSAAAGLICIEISIKKYTDLSCG